MAKRKRAPKRKPKERYVVISIWGLCDYNIEVITASWKKAKRVFDKVREETLEEEDPPWLAENKDASLDWKWDQLMDGDHNTDVQLLSWP